MEEEFVSIFGSAVSLLGFMQEICFHALKANLHEHIINIISYTPSCAS